MTFGKTLVIFQTQATYNWLFYAQMLYALQGMRKSFMNDSEARIWKGTVLANRDIAR